MRAIACACAVGQRLQSYLPGALLDDEKNLAGNFVSVANVNVILLAAGNMIHKSNSSLSKEQRMECHLVRSLQKFL